MTSNAWDSNFMRFFILLCREKFVPLQSCLEPREWRGGETIPNGQIAHCAKANQSGKRPK